MSIALRKKCETAFWYILQNAVSKYFEEITENLISHRSHLTFQLLHFYYIIKKVLQIFYLYIKIYLKVEESGRKWRKPLRKDVMHVNWRI